jgi:dihydrodipicolinate synthase/N-acetylneuraminate lyase
MVMKKAIKGVMAVVPTPFNEDETPDAKSIEKLVDFLVGHEVSMFALGSAGEGMNIPLEARIEVARQMAEANDGQMPLLVGGGTFSVREALMFIERVADSKIDGVHVIPYDGKISPAAVESMYRDIADRSPLPIWLYQNTTRTKGIAVDAAERLRDHPNIIGCKIAGFDLRLNQSFLALDREDFQVVGSADSQFFTFMCLGTTASSTSSASCFPELMKELNAAIQQDSLKAARRKNREVMAFLKRVPKGAYWHNGESSAELKYMLSLRGICKPICAKPFRMLNEEERKQADGVFADYQRYLDSGRLAA